jgi:hypothetical protein
LTILTGMKIAKKMTRTDRQTKRKMMAGSIYALFVDVFLNGFEGILVVIDEL